MNRKRAPKFLLYVVGFLLSHLSTCISQLYPPANILLIISFDGFRYDYLNKTHTPNFDELIADGVFAPNGIEPRFISKTFPNHFSIATGLYEESHGIVANQFFDPDLNDTFTTSSTEEKWWNGATPLWISNQMYGLRHSGASMWPGSNVRYENETATHVLSYNTSMEWNERLDKALGWLTDSSQPANCVFMYFEEPDEMGHQMGPDSPRIQETISKIDKFVGNLTSKLKNFNLFNSVNVILTSDHGMTSTPIVNYVNLDEIVSPSDYRAFGSSPVLHILANPGKESAVYETFLNASQHHHFKAYRKQDIPDEYYYKNNRRVMPLILEAEEHWSIYSGKPKNDLGNHGYNNSLLSMRPFFVAHGPAFKQGLLTKTFRNIDIYQLACYILDIDPLPNNGSLENVFQMLRPAESIDKVILIVVGVLLGVCLVAALVVIVLMFRKFKRLRRLEAYEGIIEEEQRTLIDPDNTQ